MRTKKLYGPQGQDNGSYLIFCPGCRTGHVFDKRWTFNGDMEKPTFRASLLVCENAEYRKRSNDRYGHRCHSFVTDGKIQFLNDCTHSMAGKTLDLPDIDAEKEW